MQTNLKLFGDTPSIFRDRNSLTAKIVPEELPHRDKELSELAFNLRHALAGGTPPNLMIYGPPGTGKTATMLKVLSELKKVASRKNVEVNVGYAVAEPYETRTLIKLCYDMGLDVPSYRGVTMFEVWQRFKAHVGSTPTIVVLDEIDKLLKASGENLLYNLTREPNISTIGISNVVTVESYIGDKRVLSSWNPRKIVFQPYTMPQLADIIEYRAKKAFVEGAVTREVVEYIASIATKRGGDARYALDLLMYAGDLADSMRLTRLTCELVDAAVNILEKEFIKNTVRALKDPEKCLLLVIASSESISPEEAYSKADRILQFVRGQSLTFRRWADYRSNLQLYGYVDMRRYGKRGKGRGVEFRLTLSPTLDRDDIVETIIEDLSSFIEVEPGGNGYRLLKNFVDKLFKEEK